MSSASGANAIPLGSGRYGTSPATTILSSPLRRSDSASSWAKTPKTPQLPATPPEPVSPSNYSNEAISDQPLLARSAAGIRTNGAVFVPQFRLPRDAESAKAAKTCLRPRDLSCRAERGVIIDVQEKQGRVLCGQNFKDFGAYVFFDLHTTINGHRLPSDTNLADVVKIGTNVYFKTEFALPEGHFFKTKMAYHCDRIDFDPSVTPKTMTLHMTVVGKERGLTITQNQEGSTCIVSPLLHVMPWRCVDMIAGEELSADVRAGRQAFSFEPGFDAVSRIGMRAEVVACEVPSYMQRRSCGCRLMAVAFTPIGQAPSTCYGTLASYDGCYVFFESIGYRNHSRNKDPVTIAMPKTIFKRKWHISKDSSIDILRGSFFLLTVCDEFPDAPWPLKALEFALVNERSVPCNAFVHDPSSPVPTVPYQPPKRRAPFVPSDMDIDDNKGQFSWIDELHLNIADFPDRGQPLYLPEKPIDVDPIRLLPSEEDTLTRGALAVLRDGVGAEKFVEDPIRIKVCNDILD